MKKLTLLRAIKKVNVLVVMTREETAKVITMMEGRTKTRGKTDVWKWVADVGDHTFAHAIH